MLVVLVFPIWFSGCQLLFGAVVLGARAAEVAADEESKKLTDIKENDLVITKTDNGVVINGYKGKNKNLRLLSEIKGMSVIGISDNAFAGKDLIGIILPNSVTFIGAGAFAKNQLTSINIPNNVTHIGEFAFYGNHLTSVTIPGNVTSIGEHAFDGNPRLSSASVPSVTRAGEGAFGRSKVTIRRTEAELAEIKAQNEAKELAAKQKQEEEERQKQEETKRREEERIKSLQQIRNMVRFDGSYFGADGGDWLAIRFIDLEDSIRAYIIRFYYQRGYGYRFSELSCNINNSIFVLSDNYEEQSVTILNNKNSLQMTPRSGNKITYAFQPHRPVIGKKYGREMENGTGGERSYLASGRFEYIIYSNQRDYIDKREYKSDERFEYSYTYSEGVITESAKDKYNGSENSNRLWVIGPYLTDKRFIWWNFDK